jgi:putative transposase
MKRKIVGHLQHHWSASIHRACSLLKLSRTVYHYASRGYDQTSLRTRIKEIAYARVRYGCQRIHVILRREGWSINHKRTYRLYCLEGLNLRYCRPRRHKSSTGRIQRLPAQRVNQCWSMDFVADNLFNGGRIRFLTVVDIFSRECLAIEVGNGLRSQDVVHTVDRILKQRGAPEQIFVDNVLPAMSSYFLRQSLPFAINQHFQNG